jgi:hypothetical protein
MDGAIRFIERRTGIPLSGELDPDTAAIVDTLLLFGSIAVRLVSTDGRWLDEDGEEWAPTNHHWEPLADGLRSGSVGSRRHG